MRPYDGKNRHIDHNCEDAYDIQEPHTAILRQCTLELEDENNDRELAQGNGDNGKRSEYPLVELVLHDLRTSQVCDGCTETPVHREDQEDLSNNRNDLKPPVSVGPGRHIALYKR